MKWALRLLAVLILAAIGFGSWLAYRGVADSLQAERNLHATLFVIRLVEQFVSEQRRWPHAWSELEAMNVPDDGQHKWPAAANEIKESVTIDFAADPTAIANQDPMAFTAIKPIGPYYEYRDYGDVPSLQSTIRRAIKKEE